MTLKALMDQYQTLNKAMLSFAEYKKALEAYLQKCDELWGSWFAKGRKNTIKTVSAWSGRGRLFNITSKKEDARKEPKQEFYSLSTK